MDAVDSVFGKYDAGPRCWRRKIDGEALAFLEQVEERMKVTGQRPTWTLLAEKLTELGFDASNHGVSRHYLGRCQCR